MWGLGLIMMLGTVAGEARASKFSSEAQMVAFFFLLLNCFLAFSLSLFSGRLFVSLVVTSLLLLLLLLSSPTYGILDTKFIHGTYDHRTSQTGCNVSYLNFGREK